MPSDPVVQESFLKLFENLLAAYRSGIERERNNPTAREVQTELEGLIAAGESWISTIKQQLGDTTRYLLEQALVVAPVPEDKDSFPEQLVDRTTLEASIRQTEFVIDRAREVSKGSKAFQGPSVGAAKESRNRAAYDLADLLREHGLKIKRGRTSLFELLLIDAVRTVEGRFYREDGKPEPDYEEIAHRLAKTVIQKYKGESEVI
jgi:hypothetical protein